MRGGGLRRAEIMCAWIPRAHRVMPVAVKENGFVGLVFGILHLGSVLVDDMLVNKLGCHEQLG